MNKMKYTTIGDIKVSQMALGCMTFYSPLSVEDSEYSMDYCLDKGLNLFDTARLYGAWHNFPGALGVCERVMGDYFTKRKNRDRVVLATKGCHPDMSKMDDNRVCRKEIIADLDESLKALQTDYVDIWFLHRDHPDCDLYDVMRTLDEQVKAGKIRVLGASNWSMERIRKANKIAEENGFTSFRVSQIEWSMAYLDMEHVPDKTKIIMNETELAEYKKGDVALMCYTAQARGFFQKAIDAGGFEALKEKEIASGKYASDPETASRKYDYPCNLERIERVKELCAMYKVDPCAVAYAYLTSQVGFYPIPIVGHSSIAQLKQSLAHPDLQLTPYQIRQILGDKPF